MRWETILVSLKSQTCSVDISAFDGCCLSFLAHVPVPLAEPTQLKKVTTQS